MNRIYNLGKIFKNNSKQVTKGAVELPTPLHSNGDDAILRLAPPQNNLSKKLNKVWAFIARSPKKLKDLWLTKTKSLKSPIAVTGEGKKQLKRFQSSFNKQWSKASHVAETVRDKTNLGMRKVRSTVKKTMPVIRKGAGVVRGMQRSIDNKTNIHAHTTTAISKVVPVLQNGASRIVNMSKAIDSKIDLTRRAAKAANSTMSGLHNIVQYTRQMNKIMSDKLDAAQDDVFVDVSQYNKHSIIGVGGTAPTFPCHRRLQCDTIRDRVRDFGRKLRIGMNKQFPSKQAQRRFFVDLYKKFCNDPGNYAYHPQNEMIQDDAMSFRANQHQIVWQGDKSIIEWDDDWVQITSFGLKIVMPDGWCWAYARSLIADQVAEITPVNRTITRNEYFSFSRGWGVYGFDGVHAEVILPWAISQSITQGGDLKYYAPQKIDNYKEILGSSTKPFGINANQRQQYNFKINQQIESLQVNSWNLSAGEIAINGSQPIFIDVQGAVRGFNNSDGDITIQIINAGNSFMHFGNLESEATRLFVKKLSETPGNPIFHAWDITREVALFRDFDQKVPMFVDMQPSNPVSGVKMGLAKFDVEFGKLKKPDSWSWRMSQDLPHFIQYAMRDVQILATWSARGRNSKNLKYMVASDLASKTGSVLQFSKPMSNKVQKIAMNKNTVRQTKDPYSDYLISSSFSTYYSIQHVGKRTTCIPWPKFANILRWKVVYQVPHIITNSKTFFKQCDKRQIILQEHMFDNNGMIGATSYQSLDFYDQDRTRMGEFVESITHRDLNMSPAQFVTFYIKVYLQHLATQTLADHDQFVTEQRIQQYRGHLIQQDRDYHLISMPNGFCFHIARYIHSTRQVKSQQAYHSKIRRDCSDDLQPYMKMMRTGINTGHILLKVAKEEQIMVGVKEIKRQKRIEQHVSTKKFQKIAKPTKNEIQQQLYQLVKLLHSVPHKRDSKQDDRKWLQVLFRSHTGLFDGMPTLVEVSNMPKQVSRGCLKKLYHGFSKLIVQEKMVKNRPMKFSGLRKNTQVVINRDVFGLRFQGQKLAYYIATHMNIEERIRTINRNMDLRRRLGFHNFSPTPVNHGVGVEMTMKFIITGANGNKMQIGGPRSGGHPTVRLIGDCYNNQASHQAVNWLSQGETRRLLVVGSKYTAVNTQAIQYGCANRILHMRAELQDQDVAYNGDHDHVRVDLAGFAGRANRPNQDVPMVLFANDRYLNLEQFLVTYNEHPARYPTNTFRFLFTDCHYYFTRLAIVRSMYCYMAGAMHPIIPGIYQMPGMDGPVTVWVDEEDQLSLEMIPTGGNKYNHKVAIPNIDVNNHSTFCGITWFTGSGLVRDKLAFAHKYYSALDQKAYMLKVLKYKGMKHQIQHAKLAHACSGFNYKSTLSIWRYSDDEQQNYNRARVDAANHLYFEMINRLTLNDRMAEARQLGHNESTVMNMENGLARDQFKVSGLAELMIKRKPLKDNKKLIRLLLNKLKLFEQKHPWLLKCSKAILLTYVMLLTNQIVKAIIRNIFPKIFPQTLKNIIGEVLISKFINILIQNKFAMLLPKFLETIVHMIFFNDKTLLILGTILSVAAYKCHQMPPRNTFDPAKGTLETANQTYTLCKKVYTLSGLNEPVAKQEVNCERLRITPSRQYFVYKYCDLNAMRGNHNVVSITYANRQLYIDNIILERQLGFKPKDCIYISGIHIFINGKLVHVYQHSPESLNNGQIMLSGRQIATRLRGDPQQLIRFDAYSKDNIDKLVQYMRNCEVEVVTVQQFLQEKKQWTKAKKMKYQSNIDRQMISTKSSDFTYYFQAMGKRGQQYYTQDEDVFKGGRRIEGVSDRQRLIWNPSNNLCGLLTYVQHWVMRCVKQFYPGFCQGMTGDQMTQTTRKFVDKITQPVSLNMDGSNHDGHQLVELLRSVDNYFWNSIRRILCQRFPNCDRFAIDQIIKQATDQESQLYCYDYSKKVRPRQGWDRRYVIRGTTFSGHPTRTTLGNTLRVLYYFHFYLGQEVFCKMDSPRDYFIFVSGDDVVLWVCREKADFCKAAISRQTSTHKGLRFVGLGQCITKIDQRQWWDIDFCSKWGFYNSSTDQWILTRNYSKALFTSKYYTGTTDWIVQNPEEHSLAVGMSLLIGNPFPLICELANARIRMSGKAPDQKFYEKAAKKIYAYGLRMDASSKTFKFDDQVHCQFLEKMDLSYVQYMNLYTQLCEIQHIGESVSY